MNIIITGATSGIGLATAEYFLSKEPKVNIWLLGRREEYLASIREKWESGDKVIHTSRVDVRNRNEVEQWGREMADTWEHVDILVNNAGLALGVDTIQDGDADNWEVMIDTNIKGLLYVTRAVMPLMITNNSGHIFNIGSTAGKMIYEKGNVYCATKYAVDALGQSMRVDLLPHNIKVTNVNPGMVETEFSVVRLKGDAIAAGKVYEGFDVLQPEDIAGIIYYCSKLPAHVNINDLTVTCTQQANSVYKVSK